MRNGVALFCQVATVFVGVAALAFMLWEPHVEGRNAQATLFEIYFRDPFLAYAYVGSLPFFMGLHQAFGLFGHLRHHDAVSPSTVDGLRAIRSCAMALIGFVAVGGVLILLLGDREDRSAGMFMCLLVILPAGSVAAAAAWLGRRVRSALAR